MSEFKVGDRVRVTGETTHWGGMYGAVTHLRHGAWHPILVAFDAPGTEGIESVCFNPNELERLESSCEESVAASFPEGSWKTSLHHILGEVGEMMAGRHKKYGPGNIAKHGPAGILVRMDDKFARLESGQGNFDDETIENTLDDIIGYAIIWKMWVRGEWPGSPVARKDISD